MLVGTPVRVDSGGRGQGRLGIPLLLHCRGSVRADQEKADDSALQSCNLSPMLEQRRKSYGLESGPGSVLVHLIGSH